MGFGAAALVVVLFTWVVGWQAVVAEHATVDPLPAATAGVFLYRLSNHWFVVPLGGLASTYLSVHPVDHPDPDPGGVITGE